MKKGKIFLIIFSVTVAIFAIWYVEDILGMTSGNYYNASGKKNVVIRVMASILLPIAVIVETMYEIKGKLTKDDEVKNKEQDK